MVFMLIISLIIVPIMAVLFDESLFQAGVFISIIAGCGWICRSRNTHCDNGSQYPSTRGFFTDTAISPGSALVVASVIVTSGFLDRLAFADFGSWLGVVVAFALIFWTAGILLFDFVVEA